MLQRKAGFFSAVVRRLPGGRGIKAPKNGVADPQGVSCFPLETSMDNLRSYWRLWSKRRTSFINYGVSSRSSELIRRQERWIHSEPLSTAPRSNSDHQLCDGDDKPLSLYGPADYDHSSGDGGVTSNQTRETKRGSSTSNRSLPASQDREGRFSNLNEIKAGLTARSSLSVSPALATVSASPGTDLEKAKKKRGKVSTRTLASKYEKGEPITMVTAYDYPSAQICDESEVDMILVGDSVAMVVLGHEDTVKVTMDEMIHHCKAVARGAKNAFLVGDMPFGSYLTVEDAVRNGARFIKEGGMDAVKLEGGIRVLPQVEALIDAGIAVIGHVGLTPQSARVLGGFRLQGKTPDEGKKVINDAKALAKAGVTALVLEMIPAPLAAQITQEIEVPTIGIGAGPQTSGQVLVFHDIVGLFDKFQPKFSKRYSNSRQEMTSAIREYVDEVATRRFPTLQHSFGVNQEQLASPSKAMAAIPSFPRAHAPATAAIPTSQPFPLFPCYTQASIPRLATASFATNPAVECNRIVVIGGGAIGSLVAGKLAEKHPSKNIHLLTQWKEHAEAINKHGLQVDGATVPQITPTSEAHRLQGADIVFVAVKARDSQTAARQAKAMVKKDGIIVVIQNGTGNEAAIASEIGSHATVAFAVTSHGARIDAPGAVVHTGEGPTTLYLASGQSIDDATERAQHVAALMKGSGFDVKLATTPDEIEQAVWNKLLVNSVVNPLAALLGVQNGKLLQHPPYARLVEQLASEVERIATAKGIKTAFKNSGDLLKEVKNVIQRTQTNVNSMLKDIQRDVPTEFDSINGQLLKGTDLCMTPLNSALNTLFSTMAATATNHKELAKPFVPEMKVATTISDMRKIRAEAGNLKIGFVPTMGALHEGHLSLIKKAKEKCDLVVASIFVNPTQFAPHEDFDKYPRPIEQDLAKLRDLGLVHAAFAPTPKEMYPRFSTNNGVRNNGQSVFVVPKRIETETAEAAARPSFFTGVATVCCKLFNIVQPHYAFFGQKDAIQCIVLKSMVEELNLPLSIEIIDTMREPDGLAMSSRNAYLSPEERKVAPIVYQSLMAANTAFNDPNKKERRVKALRELVISHLTSHPMVELGYVSLADGQTGEELTAGSSCTPVTLLSVAIKLGTTRLIDNILLRE